MLPRLLGLSSFPALRTALAHPTHISLATRLTVSNKPWSRSISMTRPVFVATAKKVVKSEKEVKAKKSTTTKSGTRTKKSVGTKTKKTPVKKVVKKVTKAKTEKKPTSAKLKFPKGPPSAFAIFVKGEYAKLSGQIKDISQGATLMKEAGEKWRNMSDFEKQPFFDQQATAVEAHKPVLEEFYKSLAPGELIRYNKLREKNGLSKKVKPKEARAPPSPYSMFLQEFYSTRKTDLSQNSNFADAAREAGRTWRALSEEEKKAWIDKYKVIRAKWEQTRGKSSD
ncbi:hypothetical protein QCA50_011074 [Cerrena zonata]|uniref:HMG box domain-containing protein n=1 Tax=Cerrena zonata TaxID=2478898 RepID=A0AAW0G343_9APHY